MDIRSEVVTELRSLFRDGATPSRLIRRIVELHPGETHFYLIQDYFREAFGVPIVRGLSRLDDYQRADLRLAYLNQMLLHEMIEKKTEWDHGRGRVLAGHGQRDGSASANQGGRRECAGGVQTHLANDDAPGTASPPGDDRLGTVLRGDRRDYVAVAGVAAATGE